MENTPKNRNALAEELAKLRAVDAWFSDDAASAHVQVLIRRFPDVSTARSVIGHVIETRAKIPPPAEWVDLLDAWKANQRGERGYCSACDGTGYRVAERVRHTRAGPHRYATASRCSCGGTGEAMATCSKCRDIGWFFLDDEPTGCDCPRGAGFDADYQELTLEEKLRADGVSEENIAAAKDPNSQVGELFRQINSVARVRRIRTNQRRNAVA